MRVTRRAVDIVEAGMMPTSAMSAAGDVLVLDRLLQDVQHRVHARAQERNKKGMSTKKQRTGDARARARGTERREGGRQSHARVQVHAHVRDPKIDGGESTDLVLVRLHRRPRRRIIKARGGRRSIESEVEAETERNGRRIRRKTRRIRCVVGHDRFCLHN